MYKHIPNFRLKFQVDLSRFHKPKGKGNNGVANATNAHTLMFVRNKHQLNIVCLSLFFTQYVSRLCETFSFLRYVRNTDWPSVSISTKFQRLLFENFWLLPGEYFFFLPFSFFKTTLWSFISVPFDASYIFREYSAAFLSPACASLKNTTNGKSEARLTVLTI